MGDDRRAASPRSAKLLRPGTSRIIAERWSPLLYVFRHYVAAHTHLGRTFRAED